MNSRDSPVLVTIVFFAFRLKMFNGHLPFTVIDPVIIETGVLVFIVKLPGVGNIGMHSRSVSVTCATAVAALCSSADVSPIGVPF